VRVGRGRWVGVGHGLWVRVGRGRWVDVGHGLWVRVGRGRWVGVGQGRWVRVGHGLDVGRGHGRWVSVPRVGMAGDADGRVAGARGAANAGVPTTSDVSAAAAIVAEIRRPILNEWGPAAACRGAPNRRRIHFCPLCQPMVDTRHLLWVGIRDAE
jgi:hypothetical protein